MSTYCLFTGRHELPVNEGPIFESWDFQNNLGKPTKNYFKLLEQGGELLVTGLTPALTDFLSTYVEMWRQEKDAPKLTLRHYDTQSGKYWAQEFM